MTDSDEKEEEQACQQHDFVSVVSSCTGIFLLCIMSSVLVPPDSLDDYYSCTSRCIGKLTAAEIVGRSH